MRGIVFLVLFVFWCQEIKSKETIESSSVRRYKLPGTKHELQKRNVSDIWNSIRNTADHFWEYIQNIINTTKKRSAVWIAKIRVKAHDLRKAFEERCKKIKKYVNEIIKQIKVTDEVIKKCLQIHKEEIDEILKTIVFDVTNCVSNSLNQLNNLAAIQHAPPIRNKTEILNVIQNDVDKCMKEYKEPYEVEECIINTRNIIYTELGIAEELILDHAEKRRASDDLLNTIVECTTDGIIKSTTAVANETINIIECVANGGSLRRY